ncbi:MAG: hypothetical protein ACYC1U_02565, partial [Candidatus Aquicultorales bacterium]
FVPPVYIRSLIRKGYYHGKGLGFIQQESTFWTADLWNKVGGLRTDLKLAGDFYLWREFAKHASLKTIQTVLASFRRHSSQLTYAKDNYYKEIEPFITLPASLLSKAKANVLISLLNHRQVINLGRLS